MNGVVHALELRAPWYACLRDGVDRFDERSFAPVIQKYDGDDFVERLVEDPSASLEFDPLTDVWTFPVPRARGDTSGSFRELLSPFRLGRSNIRKLFQPSHQRFYALTVELFCDAPGLPRPGRRDDVEVAFAVRRIVTGTRTSGDPAEQQRNVGNLKELAKVAARELFSTPFPSDPVKDVADVLVNGIEVVPQEAVRRFRADHGDLIEEVGLTRTVQGWFVENGRGSWRPLPEEWEDLEETGEEEYRMWALPTSAAGCEAARSRSLWFGVVPTYSGDLDSTGLPQLDDRSTYEIRCVARRRLPPPRQDCPRLVRWSEPTAPYRLAGFFDPAGTSNRRTHVRLPDFAAVAAQAGSGALSGGVQFETPAGSQLPAGPLGRIPDPASGTPGGDTAEICVFTIELITIVATFVLSLFMPVVIFAFQLWWMLLLRFCWPPSAAVDGLISALGSTPITGLADVVDSDGTPRPNRTTFLDMLGVTDDVRDRLFEPDATAVKTETDHGREFVESLQPEEPPPGATATPLDPLTDPLCEGRQVR